MGEVSNFLDTVVMPSLYLAGKSLFRYTSFGNILGCVSSSPTDFNKWEWWEATELNKTAFADSSLKGAVRGKKQTAVANSRCGTPVGIRLTGCGH